MNKLRLLWFVPSPVAVVADAWHLAQGVTLEAERNSSSEAQFDALASGRVDAVVTAMDNVMDWNLRTGPGDLRLVAQLERTTPLTLVGRQGLTALQDLRGSRVLVDAPRNGFIVALLAILATDGLGAGSFTLDPVGGVKQRFDAMLAGRGDATLLGPPFDGLALQAGLVRIASVQERYPAFPGQGLVVSASAMERLRPVLATWLLGLERARQRMVDDPDTAHAALELAGFPPAAVEAMLRATPTSLRPDHAGIELLIQQRRKAGLPGWETSYEQLVDASALPRA